MRLLDLAAMRDAARRARAPRGSPTPPAAARSRPRPARRRPRRDSACPRSPPPPPRRRTRPRPWPSTNWRDVGRQLRGAELQRDALLRQQRREIGEREHRMHAGQLAAPRCVSMPRISGMGVRAAHERRLQHVRKLQIVDEAAAALQQRQVLDPLDRLSDVSKLWQLAPLRDPHHRTGCVTSRSRFTASPEAPSVSATSFWSSRPDNGSGSKPIFLASARN